MTDKKIDPFLNFIKSNLCADSEGKCGFTDPFLHTHELYSLHKNVAPDNCECGKKLKHGWTVCVVIFERDDKLYLSNFVCGDIKCDYFYHIVTPDENEILFLHFPTKAPNIKIVYMKENES